MNSEALPSQNVNIFFKCFLDTKNLTYFLIINFSWSKKLTIWTHIAINLSSSNNYITQQGK